MASIARIYVTQTPLEIEKAQPYISRLMTRYPAYARGWWLKSIGKPDAECYEDLRKYLQLVDSSDSDEQQYISRAKTRIAELAPSASN